MSSHISLETVAYERHSTPSLLQYALDNRSEGRFNDVVIKSDGVSISANRMVLSCFCSFFNQAFKSETNDQADVFEIPEVAGEFLELLIQFIYTGQICIDSDNMLNILAAAHVLDLDEVKQFCFEYMENHITPENWITILITAKKYSNFKLRNKVYIYISDNYEALTQTRAFLTLKNEELFFIVYDLKTKFYVDDELLCRSLLTWTKLDEDRRKKHLQTRLIRFVDIQKLSYWLVRDLLREKLIFDTPEYFSSLSSRMEILKRNEIKILSFGGWYSKSNVKKVYSLEIDEKVAITYPDLPFSLYYHFPSLQLNNFIYCIGRTQLSYPNKVFRMDLNVEDGLCWKEIAATSDGRINCGAAFYNNALVVCGGFDNDKYLSSSYFLNIETNTWNEVSSLQQSRSGNQLVISDKCLYTLGGWNGSNYLSSVERLDGMEQSWELVSSMLTSRTLFAAVELHDVVYAIGGINNELEVLKSVERYDCAADKWCYASEMNINRSLHSACVMQGRIFVIGGLNSQRVPVKEIECYDPANNLWEIVARIDDELIAHSLVAI